MAKWLLAAVWAMATCGTAWAQTTRPVLLYTRAFHAVGEKDYAPDGPYADLLKRLGQDFDVRVSADPIGRDTLKGVSVVLIANPNENAIKDGPPPAHISRNDVFHLVNFVQNGGGLIFLSNQSSAHNCEKDDANKLLQHFGVKATHFEVGVKRFDIPKDTPIVGGLRWAFYYGSILDVDKNHLLKPRVLVENQPDIEPVRGMKGLAGPILVSVEAGDGRVIIAGDTGWLTDWAMNQTKDDAIRGQDNWTIFQRLSRWVAKIEEDRP